MHIDHAIHLLSHPFAAATISPMSSIGFTLLTQSVEHRFYIKSEIYKASGTMKAKKTQDLTGNMKNNRSPKTKEVA